ncbi:MAG: hypothetical protein AB3N14_10780 [Flavobacteriaceae bacterium]
MKKKFIYPLFGCYLCLSLLTSCVGSDDSRDMDMPDAVTYEDDIRTIVQSNCVMCHTNPPVNGAPMPLNSYDALRNAVETRPLLIRINSISNPMPPTGLLPDAPRDLIQAWVDQGFPEN